MSVLILFAIIVAWIIAILFSFIGGIALFNSLTYEGSKLQMLDHLRGVRRVYKPFRFLIVALIAWAFIFAYYFA